MGRKATLSPIITPLLIAGVAAPFAVNGDQLEVKNAANSSIGASAWNFKHQNGAQETGGLDGYDSLWEDTLPNPTQPEMKIISTPYAIELSGDSRPLQSQTVGHFYLSAINRNNTNAIINTTTNRLSFRFPFNDSKDTNRNYISRIDRWTPYINIGQSGTWATNVETAIANGLNGYGYLWMPGVTNLPGNVYYGEGWVSCKFKQEERSTKTNEAVSIDVSTNQIPGTNVLYALVHAPTNGGVLRDGVSGSVLTNGSQITRPEQVSFLSAIPGYDGFRYGVKWQSMLASNLAEYGVRILTTNMPNQQPVAISQNVTNLEDTVAAIGLSGSDADSNPTNWTYAIVTAPAHGALNVPAGTWFANSNIVYTPLTNFYGTDTFSFMVHDGQTNSEPGVVSIDVLPVNDAPVVLGSTNIFSKRGLHQSKIVVSDVDGLDDIAEVRLGAPVSEPSGWGGILTNLGTNVTFGAGGFVGRVSVPAVATDEAGVAATNWLVFDTTNAVPWAMNSAVSARKNTANGLNLAMGDPDEDNLGAVIDSVSSGSVVTNGSDLSHVPPWGFMGTAEIRWRAFDGLDYSTPTTNRVSYTNTAPQAQAQQASTAQHTPLELVLVGEDADGDALEFLVTGQPQHGTLLGGSNRWTFTPPAYFLGDDSFRFKVNDGSDDSSEATVELSVTPGPIEAPHIQDARLEGAVLLLNVEADPNTTVTPAYRESLGSTNAWQPLTNLTQFVEWTPSRTNRVSVTISNVPAPGVSGFYRVVGGRR
jgi:hypothetical protein